MEETYQELNEKYIKQLINDLKLNGFQKDWKTDKWSLIEEYVDEETNEIKCIYYVVDLNPKITFPFRVEFTYDFFGEKTSYLLSLSIINEFKISIKFIFNQLKRELHEK